MQQSPMRRWLLRRVAIVWSGRAQLDDLVHNEQVGGAALIAINARSLEHAFPTDEHCRVRDVICIRGPLDLPLVHFRCEANPRAASPGPLAIRGDWESPAGNKIARRRARGIVTIKLMTQRLPRRRGEQYGFRL